MVFGSHLFSFRSQRIRRAVPSNQFGIPSNILPSQSTHTHEHTTYSSSQCTVYVRVSVSVCNIFRAHTFRVQRTSCVAHTFTQTPRTEFHFARSHSFLLRSFFASSSSSSSFVQIYSILIFFFFFFHHRWPNEINSFYIFLCVYSLSSIHSKQNTYVMCIYWI